MIRRLLAVAAVAFLVSLGTAGHCAAGQMTYEWSGQLQPGAGGDPWMLGAAGKPFQVRAAIGDTAVDGIGYSVSTAAFNSNFLQLWVDGVPAKYVGEGFMAFTDNYQGQHDLASFDGAFEILGKTLAIGAAVTLPASTFAFSLLAEAPPSITAAVNALRTTYAPDVFYTGVVDVGAFVNAVPEPCAAVQLALAAAAGWAATRSRRMRA
jgi:hypothetical protein